MNGVSLRTTPILLYGLCVVLTGVFCTKPFLDINSYSPIQSTLHSLFAQIAGVAFCIGIITQLFYTNNTNLNYIHFTFFILVISFSVLFGLFKNYQGITQRILYLTSLFWLIKYSNHNNNLQMITDRNVILQFTIGIGFYLSKNHLILLTSRKRWERTIVTRTL